MDQIGFSLLSRLWIKEADQATLAELKAAPCQFSQEASLQELAIAYTDLFLLNVYPYASVYLDLNAEMNGLRSIELSALYQQSGYQPDSLYEVGAPDHIGLVLGLLAQLPQSQRAGVLGKYVLDWAPVLCFSIERQPSIHPFYRALAECTRRELFQAFEGKDLTQGSSIPQERLAAPSQMDEGWIELPLTGPDEELSLSQVIHYLLSPARSGMFLSRAQLGQWALELGIPLAFGERYRLGISLFEAAGIADAVPKLLDWLVLEVIRWDNAYMGWAEEFPAWRLFAGEWRERIATARNLLEKARVSLQNLPL